MQKQKLQHKIKIIHELENRIRVVCDYLNSDIDDKEFEARILELENVNFVRVNKIAKSIIINFSDNKDEILKFLQENRPKKISSFINNPSKRNIYANIALSIASQFMPNSKILKILSTINAFSLFKSGFLEFKEFGIKSSKMLEAMAVGVSLARGDLKAANGTNLLLNIGEYMEESAVHKSDELIKALCKPNISKVWIEKDDEIKQISFKDVKEGDIVVVNAGDTIPVDGYIVQGNASINQTSMTGEAEPVAKAYGDRVISGTILIEGCIKIWAELVGENTSSSKIKEYIATSLSQKSSISLKASHLADKLVPMTLGLSILSYFLNKNLNSVASVLQADYSCALKLATPTAFKTTISFAGKNGIMIKGAKAIEALSKVDTIIFDKTGTLTYGNLVVTKIKSYDKNINEKELLNMTASAEEHYFHPVAQAIVMAAKKIGFHHIKHDEVEFIVAHGVKTSINKREIVIGSRHFLEDDKGINFDKFDDDKEFDNKTSNMLFIGYNSKLIGAIGLKDEIRENSAQMIEILKQNGIKNIIMISGDTKQKAKQTAEILGINEYYGECLPTQKAKIIQDLKDDGKVVAFVGDGINDAPSLSLADVGISMHKGADIAKATADITLLKDDILQVANAKILADKTLKLVKTNFNTTIAINSAILFGATFGKLTPVQTAFLHNGTTIGLLLNSMKDIK